VYFQPRNFLGTHISPGSNDEIVITELALAQKDSLAIRFNPLNGILKERQVLATHRLVEMDFELLGILDERDVNRVRLEKEIISVGDKSQVNFVVQSMPQIKGGFESSETSP